MCFTFYALLFKGILHLYIKICTELSALFTIAIIWNSELGQCLCCFVYIICNVKISIFFFLYNGHSLNNCKTRFTLQKLYADTDERIELQGGVSDPSFLAPLLIYWTVLHHLYLFHQHTFTLNKVDKLDQSHCKAMSPNYVEVPCHLLFAELVLFIIFCSECKLLR